MAAWLPRMSFLPEWLCWPQQVHWACWPCWPYRYSWTNWPQRPGLTHLSQRPHWPRQPQWPCQLQWPHWFHQPCLPNLHQLPCWQYWPHWPHWCHCPCCSQLHCLPHQLVSLVKSLAHQHSRRHHWLWFHLLVCLVSLSCFFLQSSSIIPNFSCA